MEIINFEFDKENNIILAENKEFTPKEFKEYLNEIGFITNNQAK